MSPDPARLMKGYCCTEYYHLLGQDWYKIGTRLGQDWYKIGTRLGQDWDKIGTGFGQDWDNNFVQLCHRYLSLFVSPALDFIEG